MKRKTSVKLLGNKHEKEKTSNMIYTADRAGLPPATRNSSITARSQSQVALTYS